MDSTGVAVLASVQEQLQQQGGESVIVGASSQVQAVLEVTGLGSFIREDLPALQDVPID